MFEAGVRNSACADLPNSFTVVLHHFGPLYLFNDSLASSGVNSWSFGLMLDFSFLSIEVRQSRVVEMVDHITK